MIFGPTPLEQAERAVLAHTLRLPGRVLKKGTVLDAAALAALRDAGRTEVVAARLEPGDVAEDAAADRLAEALLRRSAPGGLTRSRAATGRVNLFAAAHGVLGVDAALVDAINALDESVTLATLPPFAAVAPGEMVATIKVIPFAVPGAVLDAAEALARGGAALALHPYRPLLAGLVVSALPGMKQAIFDNAAQVTGARIAALGGTLLPPEHVPHETAAIAAALGRLRAAGAGLLLVAGASAVVDRRDEGPAGIVAAGGEIEHFGMPVDPGNLLCLGRIGDIPALVLPGCARSPKLNGFDWVLQRLAARIPVTRRDIMGLGVGGLLMEIESRPLPREVATRNRGARRVAAVVLAAGLSRRMGGRNKLLLPDAGGMPMVARVADHALASGAETVIVVTGHQREAVEAALAGRPLRLVHAPDHAEGLSASLRAGLDAVPEEAEGVLVLLGDMPLVTEATLDRLIGAFDPVAGHAIVQPVHAGVPGNPVLWAREFLPEMRALTGDAGAKPLLRRHAARVARVEVADDSVLRDFDTEDSLPGLAAATV